MNATNASNHWWNDPKVTVTVSPIRSPLGQERKYGLIGYSIDATFAGGSVHCVGTVINRCWRIPKGERLADAKAIAEGLGQHVPGGVDPHAHTIFHTAGGAVVVLRPRPKDPQYLN